MEIIIERVSIDSAISIERQIPEFENPNNRAEYERRLTGASPLILVAHIDGTPAGYKVGYDRYGDGSYYSWVGGVLPKFRQLHVASALADEQERWAREQGYDRVVLKTKPRFENMIAFAQKRGFVLINVDTTENGEVLVLEKRLL